MGFGRLTERYYVKTLARLRDVKVTALAEPLPYRQYAARSSFPDARFYPDLESLLGAEKIDALLVAAPPDAHLRAVRAAVIHKIPLFLEKPCVLLGQLPALHQFGPPPAPFMIDFNRRFWPTYRALQRQLAARNENQPLKLRVVLHVDPRRWNAVTDHRMELEEAGLLHDLGSHALDLATFLINREPSSIRTRCQGSGDDACATLQTGFSDGSSAVCSIAYSRRPVESVSVRRGGPSFTTLHPMGGIRASPNALGSPSGLWRDFVSLTNHALHRRFSMIDATIKSALKHFFASIRGGAMPEPGWNAAIRNTRMLEAGWLSHRENRRVKLAEIPFPKQGD
jgi:predicted dehydrogenase